jgi:protein-S-isoprenylcysteine O-methyltransferase Ste14
MGGKTMNVNVSINQGISISERNRLILRRLIQIVLSIVIQATILFATSGRLDWVMAWVYIGISIGFAVFNSAILLSRNPELIAERAQMKKDAKSWDKVLATLIVAVIPLISLSVAGFDHRFEWSPSFALILRILATGGMILGSSIWIWAMASNKFFSGLVRIQEERGHAVQTSGPYRIIRHPGYVGLVLLTLAPPVMFGSLWTLIPAGLSTIGIIVRTALEDRTLQQELSGYKDYTYEVRNRLLPGIW